MKRLRTTLISFIVLAAYAAHAAHADEAMSSKSSQSAPPPTWTGIYAGLSAGGLWNSSNASATIDWSRLTAPGNFTYSTAFSSAPQTGFAWTNNPAFAWGGQVGYNWQITDRVVLGVESDFQGVTGAERNWSSGWISGSSTNRGLNSIGSVRGRAGYLVAPNLQIYGTGGLSYAGQN